jgi:CRISPR-associated protein Cas1
VDAGLSDPRELLPARMLNEFVYCPRLFYLEWVDARWADNDDTAEGRMVHHRVDHASTALPPPEAVALLRNKTSVRLESPELGVAAVLDVVHGGGGVAFPIDVKKGAAPDQGGLWPADRVQLMTQAMLLAEQGYRVEQVVALYEGGHRRVSVPVTDDDLRDVRAVIEQARQVAASPSPPLPLVDSPKCPRCSLVGLCLPDEVNTLLQRSDAPPRRIVVRDPDHKPVYVTQFGSYVGIRGGRITVRKDGETLAEQRVIDCSQLCVFGNVQVSTQALAELWNRGIPVLRFSYGGWLRGWAQGAMSGYVELRRRQVITHSQGGFDIARRVVEGKIRNSRTLLRRNSRAPTEAEVRSLASLASSARNAPSTASLLGIEGAAARIYFDAFTSMIGASRASMGLQFSVNGRNRRPAPDPVNALLSFTYSLLIKDLVAVCIGVGLDPYLGIYHRPRYGRPALALDLMEEFRPLICDSVVIGLLNNGEVSPGDFTQRGAAVWLTTDGRRTVIRAYERRLEQTVKHPYFGYTISYRRVLEVQARLMAAVMTGELPEYVPMVTR